MTGYFSTVTPAQQREYQKRATAAKRSPALKRAWTMADKIRKEHNKLSIKQLAIKYKISERSTNRIISGR